MFFFDSAGGGLPEEVKTFMERVEKQADGLNIHFKVYDNGEHEHQKGNTECGMYSLFFIITMLTGKTPFTKGVLSMKNRRKLFLKTKIPDKVVFGYRKLYFND
jgi:hypothetical protein